MSIRTWVSKFLLAMVFCGAVSVVAQEEATQATQHDGSWFIGGGYLGLDSEVTDPQGVGSGGFVLDMGYTGIVNNNFRYSVGFYLPFLSDDDSFNQRVEDQFGSRSTESSDISAMGVLGELGYQHALNEKTSFSLSAGFRTLSADREIASCSNCMSEGLNLAGGGYLRPAIVFHGETVDVEIAAMTFLSGDMTNGFMVNVLF
ncbi:hypothetical protein [Teredinibacter purpureus]|uniref:hypothetical protein n=1 Tax=Teredinibacter purpureus TaxID=2731756 RepID=UPI0005F81B5B|nr:hypothetical protein [Teredinibacter purpureus]